MLLIKEATKTSFSCHTALQNKYWHQNWKLLIINVYFNYHRLPQLYIQSVILKYCVLFHPTVMTLLTLLLPGPSVQWNYVHVPVEWTILYPCHYKLFTVCKTPEVETSSPSSLIHERRLLCKALISSAKCFLTLERHKRKVREGAFIYLYGLPYLVSVYFVAALGNYWLVWVTCKQLIQEESTYCLSNCNNSLTI